MSTAARRLWRHLVRDEEFNNAITDEKKREERSEKKRGDFKIKNEKHTNSGLRNRPPRHILGGDWHQTVVGCEDGGRDGGAHTPQKQPTTPQQHRHEQHTQSMDSVTFF